MDQVITWRETSSKPSLKPLQSSEHEMNDLRDEFIAKFWQHNNYGYASAWTECSWCKRLVTQYLRKAYQRGLEKARELPIS